MLSGNKSDCSAYVTLEFIPYQNQHILVLQEPNRCYFFIPGHTGSPSPRKLLKYHSLGPTPRDWFNQPRRGLTTHFPWVRSRLTTAELIPPPVPWIPWPLGPPGISFHSEHLLQSPSLNSLSHQHLNIWPPLKSPPPSATTASLSFHSQPSVFPLTLHSIHASSHLGSFLPGRQAPFWILSCPLTWTYHTIFEIFPSVVSVIWATFSWLAGSQESSIKLSTTLWIQDANTGGYQVKDSGSTAVNAGVASSWSSSLGHR